MPFLVDVYNALQSYLSLLDVLGPRVSTQKLRDFTLVHVGSQSRNCPLARRAPAAYATCTDVGTLMGKSFAWMFVILVLILVDYNEFRSVLLLGFVLLTQYCAGDKIEKSEMDWACGAYG